MYVGLCPIENTKTPTVNRNFYQLSLHFIYFLKTSLQLPLTLSMIKDSVKKKSSFGGSKRTFTPYPSKKPPSNTAKQDTPNRISLNLRKLSKPKISTIFSHTVHYTNSPTTPSDSDSDHDYKQRTDQPANDYYHRQVDKNAFSTEQKRVQDPHWTLNEDLCSR